VSKQARIARRRQARGQRIETVTLPAAPTADEEGAYRRAVALAYAQTCTQWYLRRALRVDEKLTPEMIERTWPTVMRRMLDRTRRTEERPTSRIEIPTGPVPELGGRQ